MSAAGVVKSTSVIVERSARGVFGCSSLASSRQRSSPDQSARATDGQATVLAAASLTEVLPRIDGSARASFGGSNQLAQQARQGFPFDVFLSASPQYTQALHAEASSASRSRSRPTASSSSFRAGTRPRITSVTDLARRPTLRLVVAGPKVPIGFCLREVLKRLGLLRVLRKTVSLSRTWRGSSARSRSARRKCGVRLCDDAHAVAGKVRIVRFPRSARPTVVYEAAIASKPRDLEAAQAFLIALLGAEGRSALRAAGFGLPE